MSKNVKLDDWEHLEDLSIAVSSDWPCIVNFFRWTFQLLVQSGLVLSRVALVV